VFYPPLLECFRTRKILHNVKLLGEHFDHQSQVGCQSIAQLGFAECQGTKTSLSSMLPRIYTMAIFANLKYSGKEQANNLDDKKVCQKHVKGFTSIGLIVVTHAFDFMATLNIDYSMSKEHADRMSRTHTSLPASFLGATKCNFNHIQMLGEAFICIGL